MKKLLTFAAMLVSGFTLASDSDWIRLPNVDGDGPGSKVFWQVNPASKQVADRTGIRHEVIGVWLRRREREPRDDGTFPSYDMRQIFVDCATREQNTYGEVMGSQFGGLHAHSA